MMGPLGVRTCSGPTDHSQGYTLGDLIMRNQLFLAVGLACVPSIAWGAQGQTYSLQFDGNEATALQVQSAGGQVRVHASREEGAKIKGQRTMGDASCTLAAHRGKGGLEVVVADAHGAPCRIDVDITVFAQTDTTIVSEEGNVFVSGMRRKLNLTMTRGNAVVGGSFSEITAHLTHGSLSAQGVGSHATIAVEEGNAQLWLDVSRGKSHVALDVVTGYVTLTVPTRDIAIDVGVPQGAIRSALTDNPEAAIKVSGQINSGSLNVRAGPQPKG